MPWRGYPKATGRRGRSAGPRRSGRGTRRTAQGKQKPAVPHGGPRHRRGSTRWPFGIPRPPPPSRTDGRDCPRGRGGLRRARDPAPGLYAHASSIRGTASHGGRRPNCRAGTVTEGQVGVRQSEAGVLLDRPLQVAHALEQNGLHVVDRQAVVEVAAPQVEVVGLGVDVGRLCEARLLGRGQLHPDAARRRRGRSRPAARACRRPPLRNSAPRDAHLEDRGRPGR